MDFLGAALGISIYFTTLTVYSLFILRGGKNEKIIRFTFSIILRKCENVKGARAQKIGLKSTYLNI